MAKTVLIVEDDRNIADLLRLYLEKEGYEVVIANDGLKGVELFKSSQPSLVLLDVMLPGWTAGASAAPSAASRKRRSSCSRQRARPRTRSAA